MLPAAFLFVFLADRRKLLDVGLMLKSAGLFFLGLAPYLYLPVRSWMDAPFLGNKPSNPERFFYLVSGGTFAARSSPSGRRSSRAGWRSTWGTSSTTSTGAW